MTLPFAQPVTLVTRTKTGVDASGIDVFSESSVSSTGVFEPGRSIESTDARDNVVTRPTIYLPTGTGLAVGDRVVIGPDSFEVDGDPQVWPPHPFTGWRPPMSVVAHLRRVTG